MIVIVRLWAVKVRTPATVVGLISMNVEINVFRKTLLTVAYIRLSVTVIPALLALLVVLVVIIIVTALMSVRALLASVQMDNIGKLMFGLMARVLPILPPVVLMGCCSVAPPV